jgi:UrcA family protein
MKHALTGIFCLCGALSVLSGAQGAGLAPLPDSGREIRSLTVSFADLDLANAAGAATLYDRLKTAARRVCGKADPRDLSAVGDVKRCRTEALDAAVAGVDNPRLTALHRDADAPQELAGSNPAATAQR